jgi:hypothetical protein
VTYICNPESRYVDIDQMFFGSYIANVECFESAILGFFADDVQEDLKKRIFAIRQQYSFPSKITAFLNRISSVSDYRFSIYDLDQERGWTDNGLILEQPNA